MFNCFPDKDRELEFLKDKPDLEKAFPNPYQKTWAEPCVIKQEQPCLIEQAAKEAERMGQRPPYAFFISCPCPRCTPRCM